MHLPKHILVATSFDDPSRAALDYAIMLAKGLHATMTVAHVYQLPVYPFPSGTMVASAEVSTNIMTSAEMATTTECGYAALAGVDVKPVVREGVTWEEVHRIAEETGADVIIVGTHGRKGLAHMLVGSVAETIIRTAKLPVIAVHAPPQN